eukprot:3589565-Pleurochrysis_carterae.AAC.2
MHGRARSRRALLLQLLFALWSSAHVQTVHVGPCSGLRMPLAREPTSVLKPRACERRARSWACV